MRQHNLVAKPEKSRLYRRKLLYLGFELDGTNEVTTVSPSTEITKTLDTWPIPGTVKDVQRFLGFINFYRQFIPNCAHISQPLVTLLKKDQPFLWSANSQKAFEQLKEQLRQLLKLATPDPHKPFQIFSDASDVAVGAVLEQNGYPIVYASRVLNEAETRYSTYDKELLAIYFALKQFKQYIWGAKKVILFCDHHSLSRLMKQKELSSRQARYLHFFADFDFEIQYVEGPRNRADALSRIKSGPSVCCVTLLSSLTTDLVKQNIERLAHEDPDYQALFERAKELESKYIVRGRLVYLLGQDEGRMLLVVPNNADLKHQIIMEAHNTPYAGHKGQTATLAFLKKHFTWSKMDSDVRDFIKHCDVCQKNKRDYAPEHGLLQPLPTPTQPWEVLGIDFVTGLPKTKAGHDAILVVIDHLTKMAHAIPCQKSITASEVADLFIKNIFRLHGMPQTIISDRGSQFISHFWQTLFKHLGTRVSLTTAYHPQSNGLTERVNGTLLETLRIFAAQEPLKWDQYLALVEFSYNNAKQTATQETPFYLNYGTDPLVPLTLLTAQKLGPFIQENPRATRDFNQLKRQLEKARQAVEWSKERMATRANKKRKPNPYQVGDQVLLSTKNLKLKGYDFPKLTPLFVGPFQVLAVSSNTVGLEVPGSLSDTFNINRLRRYHSGGRFHQVDVLPPPQLNPGDSTIHLSIDKVLRERYTGPKRSIQQYLVSFKGYGPEHNSWMTDSHLRDLFGVRFKKLLTEFRKRQSHNPII